MWYLAIVVAISLIFSGVVYHYASRELATGLYSQTERIYQEYPVFNHNPLVQPLKDLDASDRRILWRLIDFNIVVFVCAGFASYFLARRTLEPIETAHEQQKRFTADASHELRTPLTALKMEAEVALMNKQADKKELRETLESNLEEAAKMEVLINNLLRLSKLDAGQIATNFRKLSTAAITEEAVEHVAKTANRRSIHINNEARNFTFTGDQDSLVQLLVILLDNAIKYSPEKSTITLTAAQQDGHVMMSIRDQGPGIAPEALPHVFDRFYRADKSRTASYEQGYGLGLSIAKLIADVHHGTIVLHSQVGKGTTARVTLPKAQEG
jgi:signal transduction histidine kinase